MGVPIGDVARVSQVLLAQLQQSRETTGTRSAASVISQEAVTTGQVQSSGNVTTTDGFFVGDGGLLSNISKTLQEITEFGNVTNQTIVNTNETTSFFGYNTTVFNEMYMPKTVAFPKPAIDISIGGPIAITCSDHAYQTIIFLYGSYFKTIVLNPDKQTIYQSGDTFGNYDAYAKISTDGLRLLLKKDKTVYLYTRYDQYRANWDFARSISDNDGGFLNRDIGFGENVDGIDADDSLGTLVVGCPRWGNISQVGNSTWVVNAQNVGIVKIYNLWNGNLIRNVLPSDYFYAWGRYFGSHVGMSRDGSKFIVTDSDAGSVSVTRVYTTDGQLLHTLSIWGASYMKISNDGTIAITNNNLHKYLNGSWIYNVHGDVGSLTPSNSFFKTQNNILTKYAYVDGTVWTEIKIPSHIGINNIFHVQNDELGIYSSIDNKPVFVQIFDELSTKLRVEGNVAAEYFYGDGTHLVGVTIDTTRTLALSNATTGLTVDSNVVVGGNVASAVFTSERGINELNTIYQEPALVKRRGDNIVYDDQAQSTLFTGTLVGDAIRDTNNRWIQLAQNYVSSSVRIVYWPVTLPNQWVCTFDWLRGNGQGDDMRFIFYAPNPIVSEVSLGGAVGHYGYDVWFEYYETDTLAIRNQAYQALVQTDVTWVANAWLPVTITFVNGLMTVVVNNSGTDVSVSYDFGTTFQNYYTTQTYLGFLGRTGWATSDTYVKNINISELVDVREGTIGDAYGSSLDTLYLSNVVTGINVASNALISGNVTADYFIGDGSNLTGIITTNTTETMVFSNVTTGFTTDSNVVVGGNVTSAVFTSERGINEIDTMYTYPVLARTLGGTIVFDDQSPGTPFTGTLTNGASRTVNDDGYITLCEYGVSGPGRTVYWHTALTREWTCTFQWLRTGESNGGGDDVRFIFYAPNQITSDSSTTHGGYYVSFDYSQTKSKFSIKNTAGQILTEYVTPQYVSWYLSHDVWLQVTITFNNGVMTASLSNIFWTFGGILNPNTTLTLSYDFGTTFQQYYLTDTYVGFSCTPGSLRETVYVKNINISGPIVDQLFDYVPAYGSSLDTLYLSNVVTGINVASNAFISGNVTADYFIGDGSNLTGIFDATETLALSNVTTGLTVDSNVVVDGNVTANYFVGDGSNLTGIITTTTTDTLNLSNVTTGLTVASNALISGNVTAQYFIGDGSNLSGIFDSTQTLALSNVTTGLTVDSNVVVDGNVTAQYFVGDGSNLTGIFDYTQTLTLSNVTTGLTVDSNVIVGGTLTTDQLKVLSYIYHDGDTFLTTVSPSNWTQIGQDIDGEASGDQSGWSVSLSADGSIVAIGAIYNDGTATDAGHVRVYVRDGSNWVQRGQDIDGETGNTVNGPGDWFGYSVSLSSDGFVVAIGAILEDGNGNNAGYVRVYAWDGTSWVQRGQNIYGEVAEDQSGWSVSLSSEGTIVAIGARWNDGNGSNSGHVRIYEWDGLNWNQRGLDIDGKANNSLSAWSVSLSADGSIVATGAIGGNYVDVYAWSGSEWVQRGQTIYGEAGDQFGHSVSISSDGSVVAAGARYNAANGTWTGRVQVYVWDGSAWVQRGDDIDGEAAYDTSGWSVSLSADGSIVAIGAPANDGTGSNAGHVRVYEWSGSAWVQRGLDIDGEAAEDKFGYFVSLSSDGSVVAVGAPFNDGTGSDAGHVRVFELPPPYKVLSTDKLYTTSNVGIGTSTPAYTLDVAGGARAQYFIGDGSNLTGIFDSTQTIVLSNVTTGLTVDSNASVSGNLTTNQLEVLNDANISGTLTKASGTFKIDHPLSNMRSTHTLTHSFIEGPRADLIYRGKTQLVHGAAIVNIDEVSRMTEGTFNALARDAQCFVSNETDWDVVRGYVVDNTLTIQSQNTASNSVVSWMVVGERKDDHMYALDWTDDDGRVVPEKLKI